MKGGKKVRWAPRCLICGYDQTGLPSVRRCPECGTAYDGRPQIWRPSMFPGWARLGTSPILEVGYLIGIWGAVTLLPIRIFVWLVHLAWTAERPAFVIAGIILMAIATTGLLVRYLLGRHKLGTCVILLAEGVFIRQFGHEQFLPYDTIDRVTSELRNVTIWRGMLGSSVIERFFGTAFEARNARDALNHKLEAYRRSREP